MDFIETYYPVAGPPHPSALPNLRKISEFMTANGSTTALSTISARKISAQTGVSYNQVLNLIKRPGFIQVLDKYRNSVGYFYDFKLFGKTYPDTLPVQERFTATLQGWDPPKSDGSGAVSGPIDIPEEGRKKAIRQLLKDNQVIIESRPQNPAVFTKDSFLESLWPVLLAAKNGDRTPEQIAGVFHGVATGLQNGTLVLEA